MSVNSCVANQKSVAARRDSSRPLSLLTSGHIPHGAAAHSKIQVDAKVHRVLFALDHARTLQRAGKGQAGGQMFAAGGEFDGVAAQAPPALGVVGATPDMTDVVA